jgi:hypothetical protein
MLLVLAPLLVCPTLEMVLPPTTRPGSGLLLTIDFDLFRLSMRTQAHTAAQMALCKAVLVPIGRRNR